MINYDIIELKEEFNSHVKDFCEYFYQETNDQKIHKLQQKEFLTPLEYYWLTQKVKLHQTSQMVEQEDFEAAFEQWNKSQYSQFFFQQLEVFSEKKAHQITLELMRKDLDNFYNLQIESFLITPNESYQRRFEIGDTKKEISAVLIQNISNTHLKISGDFTLKHIEKIQKAYQRLRMLAPKSFQRFEQFTHTIIPTKDKEIVSFSNQDLPGFSSINLDNRDDIDLLDDLIHENGHHHLNYFLNTRELILENDEKIFFSPWRETLRPIRGIYHGFMTFYWAVELFREILFNPKSIKELTSIEFAKVHDRFIEEICMMRICQEELKKADAFITDEGQLLLEPINEEVNHLFMKYMDKISKRRFNYFHSKLIKIQNSF